MDKIIKGGVGSGKYLHKKKNFKHDYTVSGGTVNFVFDDVKHELSPVEFIKFVKKNNLENYFDSLSYNTKEFTYVVDLETRKINKFKIRGEGNSEEVSGVPSNAILKDLKPRTDKPFEKINWNLEKQRKKAIEQRQSKHNEDMKQVKKDNPDLFPDDIEKGGKKAQIGDVRKRKDGTWVKHYDGWVLLKPDGDRKSTRLNSSH